MSVIVFAPKRRRIKLLVMIGVGALLVSAGAFWLAARVSCNCSFDPFREVLQLVGLSAAAVFVVAVDRIVRAVTLKADEVEVQWSGLLGFRQIRWSDVVGASFSHAGLTLWDRDGRKRTLGRDEFDSWEEALAAIRSRVPSPVDWD